MLHDPNPRDTYNVVDCVRAILVFVHPLILVGIGQLKADRLKVTVGLAGGGS